MKSFFFRRLSFLASLVFGLVLAPGAFATTISLFGYATYSSIAGLPSGIDLALIFTLDGTSAPGLYPGAIRYGATATIQWGANSYASAAADTLVVTGLTPDFINANSNLPVGQFTGMDFSLKSPNGPFSSVYGEMYNNTFGYVTDAQGILLPGLPPSSFISNPYNDIRPQNYNFGASYVITSYSVTNDAPRVPDSGGVVWIAALATIAWIGYEQHDRRKRA